MSYAQKVPSYISPEDYLLLEERSLTKHEYLDGVIYEWNGSGPSAMAGGDKRHNLVALNVYTSLRTQLRDGPCAIFVADVKLATADDSAYFYPDVMATCSEADKASPLLVKEPLLVVEVLSPSTEIFDRRAKFATYQRVASLASYVLVSPEQWMIEVFTRDGGWARTPQTAGVHPMYTDVVDLGTHGLHLRAAEVFEGIPEPML
jgi:Uma2 family endonuclease